MSWNFALPLAQAATDTAKTAGKTVAENLPKIEAAVSADPINKMFWIKLASAVLIVIIAYAAGRFLSRRLRMVDYGWKIGLVTFVILSGCVITSLGIWNIKLGIDLQGGVVLVYQIKDENPDLDALITAIRKRIDPAGTKQVTVRSYGTNQIEIIIPAIDSQEVEQIKRNITDLGTLEFRILAHERDDKSIWQDARKLLADEKLFPIPPKPTPKDFNPDAKWVPLQRSKITRFYDPDKNEDGANLGGTSRLVKDDLVRGLYTRVILDGKKVEDPFPSLEQIMTKDADDNYRYTVEILVMMDNWNVDGGYLVRVASGQDSDGSPAVDFSFNSLGSRMFSGLTGANLPKDNGQYFSRLAIVLNREVTGAPTINSIISTRGQISGYRRNKKGLADRDSVISVLKAGQLPAQLVEEPIKQFQMDATLGKDTVRRGLFSMVGSMGLVLLFMLVYYRFSGIVAVLALTTNLVLILGVMISIKAAVTLPGLAGLVLTVGMAVDANVLIFERIREEINRGAALRMAIRNGFSKATSTIVDANLTTLITAIVLYVIGTTQIRGFAVTLILGITISMFTAIFCSRLIFDIAEKRRWLTKIKMMQALSATNINFIGKRHIAFVFSTILICVGLVAVYQRGSGLLDIDFTGGTSSQLVLKKDAEGVSQRDVIDNLDRWNDEIKNVEPKDLKEENLTRLKELFGEKLLQTLQIELASDLVEEEEYSDGIPLSDDANEKLTKDTIVGWKKQLGIGGKLSEQDLTQLDKFFARFSDDKFERIQAVERFRSTASLPDVTVTPIDIRKGTSTLQHRLYISTSNPRTVVVESILEKQFAGKLASNLIEEWTVVKEDAKPKKKPTKETPNKETTNSDTGSIHRPVGSYFVALADFTADDLSATDVQLVAQADTPKKSADDEPGDKIDPNAPTSYVLTLAGKIHHDRLENILRNACRELGIPDSDNPIKKVTTKGYVSKDKETFKVWTVTIGLPADQTAKLVFEKADSLIRASEPLLPATNKIGKQVSSKMRTDGIMAILFSLIGIVIYIWIRFQKVSFGLAAVVALVHDVLVTLGMIAMSAYLVGIPYIDPFKISLTIVAAFLTIIGYSLNDTIVVFDRIREVRGKSPELTPEMVNRSINQTLSRTLLTSMTTLMVVVILFFFGGQGIHAFSYALVVGVIVGTYSSIFVASPVLLWLIKPSKQRAGVPSPRSESKRLGEQGAV